MLLIVHVVFPTRNFIIPFKEIQSVLQDSNYHPKNISINFTRMLFVTSDRCEMDMATSWHSSLQSELELQAPRLWTCVFNMNFMSNRLLAGSLSDVNPSLTTKVWNWDLSNVMQMCRKERTARKKSFVFCLRRKCSQQNGNYHALHQYPLSLYL